MSQQGSAKAAVERVAEDGRDLYERAKDQADAAIKVGRESWEAATAEGRRQVESFSSLVRERPLLSVGIAFAAGCLISRLMHGR